MTGTYDEPLWRELEEVLDRPVPESVRDQVRSMPGSLVSTWMRDTDPGRRQKALRDLQCWIPLLVDTYEESAAYVHSRPSGPNHFLEDLGPLPVKWEDTWAERIADDSLVHLVVGNSRVERFTAYKVLPVPQKWKDHSREVLRQQERMQRDALWRTLKIGVDKWADMTFAGGPPLKPLEEADFFTELELVDLLERMIRSGDENGKSQGIWWPDAKEPLGRRGVEFGVDLCAEAEGQWFGDRNPLLDLKSQCGKLYAETGLGEQDAIRFLLCNAEVALPWLSFSIRLDNATRGAQIKFDVGSLDVPSGLVYHWYSLAREYSLLQQNDPAAYRAGQETFPSDFEGWLEVRREGRAQRRTTERGLLVEFVSERRVHQMPWQEILTEWNSFRPSSSYASVDSLKAVYRRAKRE